MEIRSILEEFAPDELAQFETKKIHDHAKEREDEVKFYRIHESVDFTMVCKIHIDIIL